LPRLGRALIVEACRGTQGRPARGRGGQERWPGQDGSL